MESVKNIMRNYIIWVCVVNIFFNVALEPDPDRNVTCGMDFSPVGPVYEGLADIESYPWLGILYYPLKGSRVTTVVVLVTRQLVIGSANEIDEMPKDDFRERSRVVLGSNCTGPGIRVREYSYHPEFAANTYSTLVLVQLDVDEVKFELFPICGPPTHFVEARFYALTFNEDCEKPVVTIHEMAHVDMKECQRFYRRSGLDVRSMWPTHTTCARAVSGGECVWRSGAALVTKLGDRWHLLGYGVYGPGCHAPARFMEYGVYLRWVKTNIARMGKTAVTRIGPGHIILRRKLSNLQRFGECDPEEVKTELYTDTVTYRDRRTITKLSPRLEIANRGAIYNKTMRYNLTIADSVEYSCVILKVNHDLFPGSIPAPLLHLRRWCGSPRGMCSGFQWIRLDFYVEITFNGPVTFKLAAYGQKAKVIDVRLAMLYANRKEEKPDIW